MKTLTAQELKERIGKEDLVVVHVLSPHTFKQQRLPGAVNIPLDELEELAPKVLPDKNQVIVVYCASSACDASPKAAQKLIEMGYTNIYDFESGLVGWQESGHRLVGG